MRKMSRKSGIIFAVLAVVIVAVAGTAWFLGVFDKQEPPAQNGTGGTAAVYPDGMSEDLYCLISDAGNIVTNAETGIQYVNNEVLLYAADDVSKSEMEVLVSEYGGEIVGYFDVVNQYQIQFADTYEYGQLEALIENIAGEKAVESADFNFAFQLDADTVDVTNDTEWLEQWADSPSGLNWGVEAINAPAAWEYLEQMQPVGIGVFDNQFYTKHEDLSFSGTWMNLYEFNEIDRVLSHGTHVAGTIAAGFNNGKGISGVSPNNENLLYGASSIGLSTGKNDNYTTLMAFECGFAYLIVEKRCSVINVSMGTNLLDFATSRKNENAVYYLALLNYRFGIYLEKIIEDGYEFVICKSAGNQNSDGYKYWEVDEAEDDSVGYVPCTEKEEDIEKYSENEVDWGNVNAGYGFISGITNPVVKDRIIVVGAIGLDTTGGYYVADFSQTGDRVDVLAPGVEIHSTVWDNGSAYASKDWSGTSMATPHVSGVAAMIFGINPDLTGADVKKIICESATGNYVSYINGVEYTHSLVDAGAAVKMALNYGKEFVSVSTGDYVGNYIFVKASPREIEIRNTRNELVNTVHTQGDVGAFITNGSVIYYAIASGNSPSVWKADLESGEHKEVYMVTESEIMNMVNLAYDAEIKFGLAGANENYLFLNASWEDYMYQNNLISIHLESGKASLVDTAVTDISIIGDKIVYRYLTSSAGNPMPLIIIDEDGANKVTLGNIFDCMVIDNEVYFIEAQTIEGNNKRAYLKKCDINGKNIQTVSGALADGEAFYFSVFRENEIYCSVWGEDSSGNVIYNYDTGNRYELDIDDYWRAYYTKEGNTYIHNYIDGNIYRFNSDTKKAEFLYQCTEVTGSCGNIIDAGGRTYLVWYYSDGGIYANAVVID